jgi:hypothetical protein
MIGVQRHVDTDDDVLRAFIRDCEWLLVAFENELKVWERNRQLLFKASLDWLRDGSVNGQSSGDLKLGN